MAVLSFNIYEYQEIMTYKGEPGHKGLEKIIKFSFPPIHVKRIQSDTRTKKFYSGYGKTPVVIAEGIENRTVTLTGVFVGDAKNASNIESYEDIFENVGCVVEVMDNAGGTIYELAKGSEWDIDSFSFDRSAQKRGIFEFIMILSYRWKGNEATE